jgi:hypothetical protein
MRLVLWPITSHAIDDYNWYDRIYDQLFLNQNVFQCLNSCTGVKSFKVKICGRISTNHYLKHESKLLIHEMQMNVIRVHKFGSHGIAYLVHVYILGVYV